MKERKIRGRSRRRKYKNQMRRPIAVLLALMLSFSSFGTATAYADDAAVVKESVDTAGTQEKVDLDKWMEKEVFDTGKQAENIAAANLLGAVLNNFINSEYNLILLSFPVSLTS